jgi:RNA polymerase sigma-70 factor
MQAEATNNSNLLDESVPLIDEIYERCRSNAPNYGVDCERFRASLERITRKFVAAGESGTLTAGDVADFLSQIQADDLFLAVACAGGSERAWWEFDQQHRSYMERVARHLAKTDFDAQEVIDAVYGELYGTKVVEGERVSKFATYSGRGSLRGWVRTVIWHSLVDLHRSGHDEVSLDEMTENVGEGTAHASFAVPAPGGEDEMIDRISTERYRNATLRSIETAFSSLEDHEKLLLLYYHVENLKLREIARLVENADSPLRGWFQRRSQSRDKDPSTRIHESTIMRWLEKSYASVLKRFRDELTATHGLTEQESEICFEMATKDLSGRSLFENLKAN